MPFKEGWFEDPWKEWHWRCPCGQHFDSREACEQHIKTDKHVQYIAMHVEYEKRAKDRVDGEWYLVQSVETSQNSQTPYGGMKAPGTGQGSHGGNDEGLRELLKSLMTRLLSWRRG